MKAYGKNLRISPKKLRVVAEVVRGNDAEEALKFLKFAPKKWADLLYKVLSSAVANAVQWLTKSWKLKNWNSYYFKRNSI